MDEGHDGINIWLAYADLFAGLLVVLGLFYGKQLEQERAAKRELQKAQSKAVQLLDKVAAQINKRYKGTDKEVRSDGTQLLLPADLTFQSGKYAIKNDSKSWLLEIAHELQKAIDQIGADGRGITIEIRGRTDAYPVKGMPSIPTNWELSSRRASEIIRLFQDNMALNPSHIHIVAVGAAEFEEYDKNFDAEGQLRSAEELEALRRIQIRIIPNYEDLLKSIANQQNTPTAAAKENK